MMKQDLLNENNLWFSMAKKKFRISRTLIVLLTMFVLMSTAATAAPRFSVATGDWSSTTTWSATSGGAAGASVPVAGDAVTIEGAHNVTITADAACTSITFPATATTNTLNINSGITLTVSGDITIPRAANPGMNTIAVGAGNLNVGSIAFTNGGGNVRHQITISTGTVTVTGNVTGTAGNTSGTISFSGAGLLKLGGTIFIAADGTLTTSTGSTVEYNAAAAQTVGDFTYDNLTLSGSGTKTAGGAITVNSNLVVGDGTTFTAAGFNLTVTGTTTVGGGTSGTLTVSSNVGAKQFTGLVTVNSGATWNNSANEAITFQGGITNNGTFTAGTGVQTFNTNAQALTGTFSIPSVTVTGVTLTNNGTLTVGTALIGTGGLTQATDATLNIGGTSTINTLTANAAGNTVNYMGAAQTVHNNNYYHLIFSGSVAKTLQIGTTTINGDLTLSGTATTATVVGLTIGGNLVIGDGTTFTAAGFNLTVTGTTTVGGGTSGTLTVSSNVGAKQFTGLVTVNTGGTWNNSGNSAITFQGGITNNGTFTAGTGVQTFNTNAQALDGANGFTFTAVTSNVALTFNTNVTINGALAIPNDIIFTNNSAVTITGNLTGGNAASAWLNNANSTLNVAGTVLATGTLTATASGNTVNYTGAAQIVHVNNYWSLGLSGSLAKTLNVGITSISGDFSMGGSATTTGLIGLTIDGNVTLNGTATFTSGAFTHNVAGNWTNNGGTLNLGSSIMNVAGTIALNTGTLNLGSGTLNLTSDLSGAGTLTGSTGTMNIGGNWTHSGTFTANTSTVNYNGSSVDQIVRGGITYYNLQISNGGTKLLQGGNTTVSNVLTLNSGIFKINDNNLILSNTTTGAISGTYSSSSMIQTNGTGYLQKAGAIWNAGGGIGFNIVYPIGSGGFYNPLDLTTNGFTATSGTGTLQISATTIDQGASALSKYWILTVTGYGGITTNLRFTYDNAEVQGTQSTYDTWYSNGAWVSAPGTHTALGVNPFGTNVSAVTAASISGRWSAGTTAPGSGSATSFYSYQSGDWADATSWTTDPSGTVWINPGVPGSIDNATILNGRTISINTNTKQVITLTVNSGGILDIKSTTGHNFGTVTGSGKLMLSSNTFPGGTYTSFVASGGGTIEYYNLNTSISTSQFIYNNLIISNNSISNSYSAFLINNANPTNYVINGNFSLKNYSSGSHTLYFGNPTASDNLIDMTVDGNFSVDAGCNIRVNNFAGVHTIPHPTTTTTIPYPIHTLSLYGNFTNNGSVRFTGLPALTIDSTLYLTLTTTAYPLGGTNYGDVQVFFYGATNNTVICNGTTDFFRLIVAKGTDKTYTLEVNSSNPANFALYAPNDQGNNQFDGLPEGFGYGAYYKAIFIHYGTLKLNENISIPSISEGGQDFNLIPTAALWINGANVSTTLIGVNGTGYQAATLYGSLRVSAGQFSTGDAAGIVLGTLGTPVILIEGTGILDVSQAWTSTGGTNQMSYIQTGGIANFRLQGENHAGPMLGLSNINSVFIMSGGTINFEYNTFVGVNTDYNIMDIQSQVGNYQVTGGTVNLNLPSSATVYTANSTVPFYNLNISRRTGVLTTTVQWNTPVPSLNIYHDLTIGSYSALNLSTSSIDLTVGRNFTIATGGIYTPATGVANTTTLNGNGSQTFTALGAITGNLQNLTLSNMADVTLVTPATPNNNITVDGNLTIGDGCTLRDNGSTIFVQGNIVNSGTHFRPVSGAGSIQLTGTVAQTISGDGTGSFNNLTLYKTGGSVTVTADMTVTGDLRLAGTAAIPANRWSTLNIGSYSLTLDSASNIYSDLASDISFFNYRMIQTNGLMSDGGVSKIFSNTNAFNFPFGFYNTSNTTYYYMPHSIQFSSVPTTYGTVTTRPVNARHPLTQSTNSLACYWKTTSTDFTGVPTGSVINNYYYDYAQSNYFVTGTEANYIPAVYGNSIWNTVPSGVITATNQVSYNADNADGEYTAGYPSAFSAISTLYSVANGNWNIANTWSTTRGGAPGNGGTPAANTLVYICDGKTVTTTAAASASSLTIETGSTLDLQNVIGHNFVSIPTCGGTLRIASTGYFPSGDWGYFLGSAGGTVEYYTSAGNMTIPTTSASGLVLGAYKNLKLTHSLTYTITLPDRDLTIYGDLTVSGSVTGSAGTRIAGTSWTYTVNGNLNINSGVLEYRDGVISTIKVLGNTSIAAGASFRAPASGALANVLELYGNLACLGTFDMNNTGRVYTYFKGAADDTISGAGTIDFYNLFVDKGSDTTSVLTVTANSITTVTNPFLTLSNGTFRVNNSALTLTITTAGTNFNIPSTACLSVVAGTVRVAYNTGGGANTADLMLAGKVEVSGGSLLVGNSADNTNNDIEYASAGLPEINIAGGQLIVNGQIRRGTIITSGSLNYSQSGGTVTIGGRNVGNSRSTFEVLNAGSKFDMSNGTLIIANHFSTYLYDLAIETDNSDVTGGTIQFGQSGVTANNTLFSFKSSVLLGNLTLEATSNSWAIQQTYNLDLLGNLTIGGSSSYYNTNGLDITIGGNLINNNIDASTNGLTVGGFRAQVLTQTTSFLGSADQTITGTTTPNRTNFANLEVATTQGDTLFLSNTTPSNITVNGDLTLTSGVLNDGGNTINLLNNVDNDAAHYSPNATSGGMIFNGIINQGITGSGSGIFGNIEINNVGNGIDMTDNSTMNGQVKFSNGYLYIDNYALTLGQSAAIAGIINVTNQIVLNGVSGDNGVTKIFPTGASSFTFPIGDNGKYTPCTFNFTANANATGATINVVPIDALHPSIDPDSVDNYLNYYWKVVTTGFSSSYNVTHTYNYINTDVDGNPANIERCDNSTSAWSTVTGTISSPTFSFSSAALLDGSYTIGDNFASLPPATSTKSGNWNDSTVWSTNIVPNGNAVVIQDGHTVALNVNGANASTVVVNGVLDAMNTTFHNMGIVSGTGKIKLLGTGAGMFVFPGGSYDAFLANPVSTVEFYGNTNSTMPLTPGNINKPYQNVILSGTGIKYISSINMQINGNLTISPGSKLDNTLYNKDLIVLGNWIDQDTITGGFNAGTGTVRFNGTTAQNIIMANSSMKETFYNLAINNTSGLTINTGNVDVSNQLILTLGNIITSTTNSLTITNTNTNAIVGGSVNSFVNGPLRKKINNGSSFQFPVGDAISSSRNRIGYVSVSNTGPSGSQIWTAQFFDKNPTADGYDITNITPPLNSVVYNEYWNVIGPTGGSANVVLNWDQYTGMSSSVSTRALSMVAEWNMPVSSSWNSVGQVVTDFGQSSGTVATSTPVSLDDHIFTIGATSQPVASLITAIQTGLWNSPAVWGGGRVPGPNDTVAISSPFTVTLNLATTIAKLIVDNGGTFDNSTNTLNITDNLVLNGTWTGTGTGKISMTTDGDTLSGSGSVTGTSLLEIAGNNKTIASTANLTLKNVSILNNETLKNNGTVTIDDLTGAANSTFVNASGSTLVINGQLLSTGILDASTCPNTVIYNGTIAQIIKPTTYCHIIMNNIGLKTASADFGTNGDLTVNFGSNLTINNNVTIQVRGITTTSGAINNGGHLLISD
jgi:hypothetical protein